MLLSRLPASDLGSFVSSVSKETSADSLTESAASDGSGYTGAGISTVMQAVKLSAISEIAIAFSISLPCSCVRLPIQDSIYAIISTQNYSSSTILIHHLPQFLLRLPNLLNLLSDTVE